MSILDAPWAADERTVVAQLIFEATIVKRGVDLSTLMSDFNACQELADVVLASAWNTEQRAAATASREALRTELEYRLRTTAARYKMAGKHGEQVPESWIAAEIDAAVARLTAGSAPPDVPDVLLEQERTDA